MSTPEIPAGTWTIDPSHSEVGFSVRHLMVSKVKGNFETFEGTVTIGDDPLESSVTAKVDLNSINTRDAQRDGHLRSADFFEVETYPTVHQLTSDVVARTRDGVGLVDVFGALFPSGSVTGAPKRRTMEIIRDVEAGPRGVYCGAVGVVAPPDGPMPTRFNVPIRTLLVDRDSGTGVYGAGGGITWDSDPDAEYDELLAKARILVSPPSERRPRT